MYVPSVRKQRPAPPQQPESNEENEEDVLCRVVPSQSHDATYRLGGRVGWHCSRYFCVNTPGDDSQYGPCN
jgi:hypothetical protein